MAQHLAAVPAVVSECDLEWSRPGAGLCPTRIANPLLDQDWVACTLLHWSYPPDEVQRLLPQGLQIDTFDGAAWVTMVPFLIRIRIPHGPVVPWVGVFPEVNVRTYVRGPDGHHGIWFFSLEAPRRLAVWAARRSYHLPYQLASVEMRIDGRTRAYASRRLGGAHAGASSAVRVEVGEAIGATAVSPLEHFLTARWRLYSRHRGHIGFARVAHAPWRLHRATLRSLDAGLLRAAGLSTPAAEPLVHACEDVHASFSGLG